MLCDTEWERKRFQYTRRISETEKDQIIDYETRLSKWVDGCCKLLQTSAIDRLQEILRVKNDPTIDLSGLPVRLRISWKSKQRIQNSIETPKQMAEHIEERVSSLFELSDQSRKEEAFNKVIPKIIISSTMAYAAKKHYEQYGLQVRVHIYTSVFF